MNTLLTILAGICMEGIVSFLSAAMLLLTHSAAENNTDKLYCFILFSILWAIATTVVVYITADTIIEDKQKERFARSLRNVDFPTKGGDYYAKD